MKILSIRQPWAYLITQGSKEIENRSWATTYRGLFLIHASLMVDKMGCLEHGLDPSELQTGGVVGMAEIVDASKSITASGLSGPSVSSLKIAGLSHS
jgi:ASCH domain